MNIPQKQTLKNPQFLPNCDIVYVQHIFYVVPAPRCFTKKTSITLFFLKYITQMCVCLLWSYYFLVYSYGCTLCSSKPIEEKNTKRFNNGAVVQPMVTPPPPHPTPPHPTPPQTGKPRTKLDKLISVVKRGHTKYLKCWPYILNQHLHIYVINIKHYVVHTRFIPQ